ncbi:MAG: choice-of-anchor D domain-containing protein, partial [Planctomycetes bacterium]|nr:choice-of-anchor D domain-containing protein [Planctomycetota bacterium]
QSQTAFLSDLTNAGTFIADNNSTTHVAGTITNNGTMTISAGASLTDLVVDAAAILTGGGSVTLSGGNARVLGSGMLTNAAGHTIQGQGSFGLNTIRVVNDGLIDANVNGAVLLLDPSNGGNVFNNGILEASDGGIMNLSGNAGGTFTNNGTIQALNGSAVQTVSSGVVTNNVAGTLTGGSYRSVSTGDASSVALNGPGVSAIAADTTVELSGAAATMTFGGTALHSSLVTNSGALKILDGHTFNMTNALANNGILSLGGAGLADATLDSGGNITNTATGEIFGHGTIEDTILNSGLVRAANGTLTLHGLIDGQSGTIQIDPGASMDLSGAGGDSDTDFLIHNGVNLNLGANNLLVRQDYTNGGFGAGNSFNHRANVTGTGLLLAEPSVTQTLTGDVAGGTTAAATMDFGNLRVGEQVTRHYAVNNVGDAGPVLRGAIQTDNTTGNGGNITDARLSGSGVTTQNFGPINNNAATADFAVTFTGTSAGALTGQQVALVNNFDNVGNQTLSFTGAAYNAAVASVTPSINLGDFHVGDVVPGQAVSISNTAPVGAFAEDLRAENITANPDAILVGGSPSAVNVLAGGTNTEVSVAVGTATAGNKTGTVTMDLLSNATVNGAAIPGLSPLSLGQATVNVSAAVYNLAAPVVDNAQPIDFGVVHVGDSVTPRNLSITNDAPADGFSEGLNAAFGVPGAGLTTNGGSISLLAAQNTDSSSMSINVSTATNQLINSGVPVLFQSDGTGLNGLGQTDLGTQNVSVVAQVNSFAEALFSKVSGDGSFLMNGPTDYALDFGTVLQGTPSPAAGLSLLNDVLAPADDLAGSYVLAAPGFLLSGFGAFSGLAAGSSILGLDISLDTSTLGSMTGTVTLMPRSENLSGFSGPQPDVVIHLSGNVVPEPSGIALCLLFTGVFFGRRRIRRR